MKNFDKTAANKVMNLVVMGMWALALVAVSVIPSFPSRLWVMLGVVGTTMMAYASVWLNGMMRFDVRVQHRLKKAGLQSKVKADAILVKNGDMMLKAQLWNRPEGSKRVHFMLKFAPNVLEKVSHEGWAVLTAECNAHNTYTTVQFYGDHFVCQVETSVKTSKDFLREYMFACDKIVETMHSLEANTGHVVKNFPAVEKRQVGFRIPQFQEVEECAQEEDAIDVAA